jgi:hypothetical protein
MTIKDGTSKVTIIKKYYNSLSTGFKSRNKEMAKPEKDNMLHCKKHKNTKC